MKKLIIIIFIIAGLAACKSENKNNTGPSKQQEALTHISNDATDQQVIFGPLEMINYSKQVQCTGVVDIPPTDLVSVHSKLAGSIEFIKYLPGDYITRGTLLFKVFNPENLSMQRQLLEIRSELDLVSKEYERKQKLFENGAINDKEFQQAEFMKKKLDASFEGYKKELSEIGINVQELVDSNHFQSYVPVYSRIAGYVQQVYVNLGQVISPQDKLMDIANNDHLHLELDVFAKDVPYVKVGQKVRFTLPKKANELVAEIVKLNPMLDETSGTRTAHCHIDAGDSEFVLPGMFVNATIDTEPRQFMGLSPAGYIKEGEAYYIFKKSGNELVKIEVENPEKFDEFLIIDGLSSDTFVIKGAYYIE
jgi:cobalt-zinc-cadmium efflux system membrane fusion protein